MGLFGNLVGGLVGQAMGGGVKGKVVQAMVDQVMNSEKGLSGVVEQFDANGLGELVNSWIGTGQNASVSPEQVEKGFGLDMIRNIATEAKADEESVKTELSDLLPGLIDQLTPDGQLPGNIDIGSVTSVLGSLLKK